MLFARHGGRRIFVVVLGTFMMANQLRAAMIVRDYIPARHDRFRNDAASFVGSAAVAGFDLDFSGVARSDSGRWGTMVGNRYFLSATHFHPTAGAVLTFHQDNDPAGGTVTRTVHGGSQIGNTDIWLGMLNTVVDPSIAVYSIALPDDHTGEIAYQAGLANGNLGIDNSTNFRVGRNKATEVEADVILNDVYFTDSLIFYDDSVAGDLRNPMTSTPDLIADETFFQAGDSGGPSFLVSSSGELIVLGMHSFITTDPADTDRLLSGDAYLPNYRSDILAAIDLSRTATCDFDVDLDCDVADLDMLGAVGDLASGVTVTSEIAAFDIDFDNQIDLLDRDLWLSVAASKNGFPAAYPLGDANLDGKASFADFFNVQTSFGSSGNWSTGDFNLDGIVSIADFLILQQGFSMETATATAIPEPTTATMLVLASLIAAFVRRRTALSRNAV